MGIKHLPAIDGLRAVAVLSVIVYHVGAPAGFVGVDVFFVISGYLITRILMERPPLVEFYARRARRILPAAFLVVSVTLGLSMLLLPSSGDVARSAAAAGVFVANLFFQSVTGGYWSDDAASMPLLHLWSLSVEEQFYLAWPLLILFGRKWIGWVFGLSLALYAYLSWANPEAAFYQTPARAWELAAGGLVALGKVRPLRGGLPVVILACLAPLPVWVAQPLAVLGATLFVATAHAGHRSVLEARPIVYVGLISYSLYLWHWPLLVLAGESQIGTKIGLMVLAFALSVLTYRYVETPFRRLKAPALRTILVGFAPGVVAVVLVSVWQPAQIEPPTPSVYANGCDSWTKSAEVHPCTFGKATNGRTVVVMGDSVALQWFPALHTIFADWNIVVLTKSSCAMVDEPFYYERIKSEFTVCAQWRRAALKYANDLRPDLVIMGSSVDYRFTPEQWTRGTEKVLQSLPDAKRIRILRGTPFLAPWNDGQAATDSIRRGAARYANVAVVDMTDAVCRQGCSRANYRDVVHLKSAFVTSLTADLRERLCVTCGGTGTSGR